jgi:hypothetical protein
MQFRSQFLCTFHIYECLFQPIANSIGTLSFSTMVVHPLKDFAKVPFNEVVESMHGDIHDGLTLERCKILQQQFGPNKLDMEEKVGKYDFLCLYLIHD